MAGSTYDGIKRSQDPEQKVEQYTKEECARLRKAFGYSYEEYHDSIRTMALNGTEGITSMGVDTPLAALSNKQPLLFSYFKQRFAQVTNPPIDAVREKIVTNTSVYIGKEGNILKEQPENCQVLKVNNPILSDTDLLKIKGVRQPGLYPAEVMITCMKHMSLKIALERLFIEVDRVYKDGASILILTDRGVDETHVAIPSLLAVSAVHHYLVRTKKRVRLCRSS